MLCDKLGIPCVLIGGNRKGENGQWEIYPYYYGYMWNGVQVDGKWYLMDVAWDDRGGGYQYFLTGKALADREILNTLCYVNTYDFIVAYPEFSGTPWAGVDKEGDHEHVYCAATLKTTAEPTCSTPGKRTYDCIFCGKTERKIAPLGHVFHDGTCSRCGTGDSLAKASVAGIADKAYTGAEITQNVTVSFGTNVLKPGVDYKVAYSGNKNAGTATVTVSGTGKYSGTVTRTFRITPRSVNDLAYSVKDQTYTGKALQPPVTVKDGAAVLKANADYTVSYGSNQKIGTATATVTGKGNYTGSKTVSFQILPKKAALKTLKSKAAKALTVTWGKGSGVSGYQIEYAKNKNFKSSKKVTVKKAGATSHTIKKLTGGTKYFVRIRAYKTVKGKNYYSAWSGVKNVTVRKK